MTGWPCDEAEDIVIGDSSNQLRVTRVYSVANFVNNGTQSLGSLICCFICVFTHKHRQDFFQVFDIVGFSQLVRDPPREIMHLSNDLGGSGLVVKLFGRNPEVAAIQFKQKHIDLEGRLFSTPSAILAILKQIRYPSGVY